MKKINEVNTSKDLIETIMDLLQVNKKQLAAGLGCTLAQLNVLLKKDKEVSKLTKLERELVSVYLICQLNKQAGAGELRRLVEEAFNAKGNRAKAVSFAD